MAYSTAVRNFRDGSLVIKDGSSPAKVCTVICDEGNLQWTETKNHEQILCRGQKGGVREGDFQGCQLTFTGRVQQLLGYTEDSSDPITLYEIINNIGDAFTSVADDHYALNYEFTINAPPNSNGNDEKIVFGEVRKESLVVAEGNPADTIAFSGVSNNELPTITQP